eukprot:13625997-Alexandrium_andersonii.AAC.1
MARLAGPGNRYLETFRATAAEAVHLGGAPAGAFAGPPPADPVSAPQAPQMVGPDAPGDPKDAGSLVRRVLAATN